MISRQQYMADQTLHHAFYLEIAKDAGISYSASAPIVIRAKEALAKGDEHLNTIPLSDWDRLSPPVIPYYWSKAFKNRGDFATLAGLVCMHKAAVREACK